MRVLIVEDDNMIAEAVCANLKDSGYAVDRVKNGAQTAAAVQAQEYDLLLLDLGLPGLDGLQVLARLRSSGCQVPVLIVTARDDLHSRLHGLDGGADDYIVKPFDMAELQARMRAILRRNSGLSASSPLWRGFARSFYRCKSGVRYSRWQTRLRQTGR